MIKRGDVSRILLFVFLLCILALSAQAQTVINNCSGIYNVPGAGKYVLSNNISNNGTCINIAVSNVHIDCRGFSLRGNTTGSGVNSGIGMTNVTIENCSIYNFSRGIQFATTSNSLLLNNLLMYNAWGVHLWAGSNNVTFRGNTANNNTVFGFVIAGLVPGDNLTFIDNEASHNLLDGFHINNSKGNLFRDNIANDNNNTQGSGFFINEVSHSRFINNTANRNSEGFELWVNCTNNNFTGNTAINNSWYGLDIVDGTSPFNIFTQETYSNPAGVAWDLHVDSENCSFYNILVSSFPTWWSCSDYNATFRLTGTQKAQQDPAGLKNISKYVNVSKNDGDYFVLNISYTNADIVGVQEATLTMYRYNGTAWVAVPNSTVHAAQNLVSARLTQYSAFGVFGQQQQQQPRSGGGGSAARNAYGAVLPVEDLDSKEKVTKTFRTHEAMKFRYKNEEHTATVLAVDMVNQEVTVQVASTPQKYVLTLNQTIKMDIDGNGYDDLSVCLDYMESGAATLTISRIAEAIPVQPLIPAKEKIEVEELMTEPAPEPAEEKMPAPEMYKEPVQQEPVPSKTNILLVVIIVVVFAAAFWVLFGSKRKRKK